MRGIALILRLVFSIVGNGVAVGSGVGVYALCVWMIALWTVASMSGGSFVTVVVAVAVRVGVSVETIVGKVWAGAHADNRITSGIIFFLATSFPFLHILRIEHKSNTEIIVFSKVATL